MSPFACAALALTAAALLQARPAQAATLQLSGPAGAGVTIDGRAVGFLPLAEALTLSAGEHELLCEMPGHIPHRQTITFMLDDEWRHVSFCLLPFSRNAAVFSNLALAGLGQRYLGHDTRGWIYSVAEVGGLVTALYGEITRSNANEEYLIAMDLYGQAINADDIAALRAEADDQYRKVVDAADLRDLGLMTAAGAIVVSMVDAWLSFPGVTAGAGELPSGGGSGSGDDDGGGGGASFAPTSPSFHSALRLRF